MARPPGGAESGKPRIVTQRRRQAKPAQRRPNRFRRGKVRYKKKGRAAPPRATAQGGSMALCPECEANLDFDEDQVDEGAVVSCPDCGTDFEVVNAHPLELNALDAEDDDEDFDEDEDEEEGDDEDFDEDEDEDEEEEE